MLQEFDPAIQDLDQLRAIIARQEAELCVLAAERDQVSAERDRLDAERKQAALERDLAKAELDKLQLVISQLQRRMFGRRSEKMDPAQLDICFEEREQIEGELEAQAAARADATEPAKPRAKARRNHGHLPKHLPRIERVIEPEDKVCPCCHGDLHLIGEDISEQLDAVPAKLQVIVTRRPRYGCRTCEGAVVQAHAPERPITHGMATCGFLAQVLVSKFADHIPLYRQSEILERSGIQIDRSTLGNWVGQTCWWLRPIYERMHQVLLTSSKIFADETPLPVLAPKAGKTKTGYMWTYAIDDRPWLGDMAPMVIYIYGDGRGARHVQAHLASFSGVIQVDAYGAYNCLTDVRHQGGPVILVFCWTHWRRKLYDYYKSTDSPIAKEAIERIDALYAIEARIRGFGLRQREIVRDQESRPLVEAFKPWLEERLKMLSGKSKLAEIIRYVLRRWDNFTRFLDDGRLELDTNVVERANRLIALGRKNSCFAGSDRGAEHWAIAASLIQTCKLNHVEPQAYLTDILERMVSGQTLAPQIDQLLPWNWSPLHAA